MLNSQILKNATLSDCVICQKLWQGVTLEVLPLMQLKIPFHKPNINSGKECCYCQEVNPGAGCRVEVKIGKVPNHDKCLNSHIG